MTPHADIAAPRPSPPGTRIRTSSRCSAQRRFAPFFWTQFLGAGNDNLFKFAFTVMVTYQLQVSWLPPELAGLVIGALFILPFLLFSATSGQLADKFDKARADPLRQVARDRDHGARRRGASSAPTSPSCSPASS